MRRARFLDVVRALRRQDWGAVVGLGILVRLILMPIAWHNDAVWMPWMAHLIVDGSPNMYQTLFDRFGQVVLSPVVWAPYLPLFYYFLAGWTALLEVLHLSDVGMWSFSSQHWSIPHFPRAVFLAKLPWVVADLMVWGIVLSMLEPNQRKRFSWLYLFFPSQIWVSSVMGQNDILPTLATVIALWSTDRALRSGRFGHSLCAVLALGFGAGVKLYPLFLLLPTALILGQSIAGTIALSMAGVLPVALAVLPFLHTSAFVEGVLLNPEGIALFDAAFGSGIQTAPVFVVLYGLLLAFLAFYPYPRNLRSARLTYLVVLSFVLICSAWPFNWLVWIIPLLAWSIAEDDLPDAPFMVVGLYFVVLLAAWGKVIGGYTFYPLARPLRYFTSLRDLIDPFVDFMLIQNWAFALFVASIIAILAWALKPPPTRRKLVGKLEAWSSIIPFLLLFGLLTTSTLLGNQEFVVHSQSDSAEPPILLDSSTVVEQSVNMEIDGLESFSVGIGSPVPADDSGELRAEIEASGRAISRSWTLPAKDLTANGLNRFSLGYPHPADVYTFTLRWNGDSSVPLERSATDVLPDNRLRVNGKTVQQDLVYQTIADADWRAIGSSALARFLDDLPFSLTWLLVIVLVASASFLWDRQ